MKVHLGVKSDPIEARYSFEWLFDIMQGLGIHRLQIGSSYPTFSAEDEYFKKLRAKAEKREVRISSLFTSHRELGGFASGDPLLEDGARRGWERIIHVAALLGAESAGSNAGITLRDQPHLRERGIRCFFENMKGLLAHCPHGGSEDARHRAHVIVMGVPLDTGRSARADIGARSISGCPP